MGRLVKQAPELRKPQKRWDTDRRQLSRQFRRRHARFQRENLGSHGAALCALEVLKHKARFSRVPLEFGLHHGFAAFRADFIGKLRRWACEFPFALSERRTLDLDMLHCLATSICSKLLTLVA